MSNAPFATKGMRWGHRMFNTEMLDLMVHDGLWDAFYNQHMAANSGAIAFEHPIGASCGRILATLVHEMRHRKATYGIAAICSGGAQGDAVLIRYDY